ncbi:MAG: hypothetical protein ACPGJI_09020, partial [Kangiellaceae bacterium]
DQQRLILNIIIFVIAAFILIFMLLGKLLSSTESTSFKQSDNQERVAHMSYETNELNSQEKKDA